MSYALRFVLWVFYPDFMSKCLPTCACIPPILWCAWCLQMELQICCKCPMKSDSEVFNFGVNWACLFLSFLGINSQSSTWYSQSKVKKSKFQSFIFQHWHFDALNDNFKWLNNTWLWRWSEWFGLDKLTKILKVWLVIVKGWLSLWPGQISVLIFFIILVVASLITLLG